MLVCDASNVDDVEDEQVRTKNPTLGDAIGQWGSDEGSVVIMLMKCCLLDRYELSHCW